MGPSGASLTTRSSAARVPAARGSKAILNEHSDPGGSTRFEQRPTSLKSLWSSPSMTIRSMARSSVPSLIRSMVRPWDRPSTAWAPKSRFGGSSRARGAMLSPIKGMAASALPTISSAAARVPRVSG